MDQYDSLWWCKPRSTSWTRGAVDIPADTQPPAPTVASKPSPLAEPRIAIPIIEYRGLCHTFQALATSQSILTQQITTLHAHQDSEHAIPSPPEPAQAPPFMHETMPPEEPLQERQRQLEPSSPQHHPPTI
ncbi:hypothetical protein CK203_101108 [Vitis vinifera]|uniref:Uncharacterized protein n=1 Tax=Vitis vinifera TaxID=29760 RepID=A0A438C535_VITVI|nr:hypothetical protein CK203_101108 [Vitis vinifera]